MASKYRGKYPTRLHTVWSERGRLLARTNDGTLYSIAPITAQGRADMPRPGRQIGDYIEQHYNVAKVSAEGAR